MAMSGLDGDELVCICHEVSRATLRRLAAQHRSVEAVIAKSTICQTCQGCESEIRSIVAAVLAGREGA